MRSLSVPMPRRFYSLDVIRGLAALSVVVWHWPHFFYQGTVAGTAEVSNMPFYSIFFLFYHQGWLAVDFFFSLSGFIFFWLYMDRISSGKTPFYDFCVLRFSRLYPLHLLTLLLVTAGQFGVSMGGGDYVIYSNNDLRHFGLQLMFASHWGLQDGFSFNGPVWSVSVEVLLYGLFFAAARLMRLNMVTCFVLIGFGVVISFLQVQVGRGIFSFFLGGFAYLTYMRLVRAGLLERVRMPLCLVTLGLWAVIVLESKTGLLMTLLGDAGHAQAAGPDASSVVKLFYRLSTTMVVFPVTILTLAVLETVRGHLGRSISFIGNISYSSYLWAFPLTFSVILVTGSLGIDNSIFYRKSSMLIFYVVLIMLSMISFYYFERPVQRKIRAWAIKI